MQSQEANPSISTKHPSQHASESSSEEDDEQFDPWTIPKPPPSKKMHIMEGRPLSSRQTAATILQHQNKFDALRRRRTEMQERTELSERRKETRKLKNATRKEVKKAAAHQQPSTERPSTAASANDEVLSPAATHQTETEWKEVQSFLDINSHLAGPVDHGWCGPKTDLQRKMEKALHEGQVEEAEAFSDQMANRTLASRVHEAFEARKYAEDQMRKKEIEKAKQSKKLHWGFEAKHRWETKGNL